MLSEETPPDPAQAKARLQAKGLDPEVLRYAVSAAYEESARTTENDVASMAGFLNWGRPLRHLRDSLKSLGWTVSRARNFETVVSPDGSFQIASAAGDGNTGRGDMPSTRTERGPRTKDAVARNQMTFDPKIVGAPTSSPVEPETWFLLHHKDEGANEIRLELSRPVAFAVGTRDGHGVATNFRPRLRLDPVALAQQPAVDQEEAEEEIDVPIQRRAND